MKTKKDPQTRSEKQSSQIYLSVDHLKQGMYQLHLMCEDKILKTVKFKK